METVTASEAVLARTRVVLVRPSHPGNIGAAARAIHTMGLHRLVVVAPQRAIDAQSAALAAGAAHVLEQALVVDTLDEALNGCTLVIGFSARPREFAGRVLPVREAAQAAVQTVGEVALVFGTEMSGLSNDELALCTLAAAIPANPGYASLNLAAAVQVAAYELRMASGACEVWSPPRFALAAHEEIEALHAHARRTLVSMRILNPGMPRRLLQRLRRLFGRTGLEREEVNILRGILARIDALVEQRGPR